MTLSKQYYMLRVVMLSIALFYSCAECHSAEKSFYSIET
jgi:hypothetical protein